jgi:GNAT superfamily N-acetyltransferase
MIPERLTTSHEDAVVDVLCDAFAGYPVMRYVLDDTAAADDPRLRMLVGFFARARLWRGHPVFGIRDGDTMAAVATVTPPDGGPEPPGLAALREVVWGELGADALERYEAFGRASRKFEAPEWHHHLNMIGVRTAQQGRGLARPLLEAVHQLAATDPGSAGVTLTTERRANLPLYDHFGYRRIGHARVAEGLETWGFFRPR